MIVVHALIPAAMEFVVHRKPVPVVQMIAVSALIAEMGSAKLPKLAVCALQTAVIVHQGAEMVSAMLQRAA